MSWVHLVRWELVRALREANTLLYLGFPLIAYPATIWGTTQALRALGELRDREPLRVAVHGPLADEDLGEAPVVRVEGDLADLDAGRVDAVVEGDLPTPTVHLQPGAARSRRAAREVEERLETALERRLGDALGARGAALPPPLALETEGTDSPGEVLRWLLAILCASILPAAVTLGALSPCSELFVAERERSSLETTLTAPVSRERIALARLLVATGLAGAAGVANVFALALTVAHSAVLVEDAGVIPRPTASGLLAVAALAGTSAALVSVGYAFAFSLARSFREAQSVASPVLMVLILPSLAGTLAIVGGWADELWWVPLVHTSTLVAASIDATAPVWKVAAACAIDLGLAGGLVAAWFRVLGAEALLAGLARPPWLARLIGEAT